MGDAQNLSQILGTNSSSPETVYGNCLSCGAPVRLLVVFGKALDRVCDACAKQRQDEEQQAEEREQAAVMAVEAKERLAKSNIGDAELQWTFENWQHRPGSEAAYRACRSFVDEWPDAARTGRGLVLMGVPGNGKSHLATACALAVIDKGWTAEVEHVPILMRELDATYKRRDLSEADLLLELCAVKLLVLDDIGAQKWSEAREERIFAIIDDRIRHRLPTLITTNCETTTELEASVGRRTLDRILGSSDLVLNKATSYRLESAKARRSS